MWTYSNYRIGATFGSLYEEGTTPHDIHRSIERREIKEGVTLVVGKVGTGKSTHVAAATDELYEHGYNVIFMTCKQGSEFDNCYSMFKPMNDLQIGRLNAMNMEKISRPTFMYHPFSQLIPNNKLPIINMFTFDLRKALTHLSLSALMGKEPDSDTVDLVAKKVTRLKSNETIFDLLNYLKLALTSDRGLESHEKRSFAEILELQERGNKKTITAAATSFDDMKDNYFFLQESDYEYNLNFVDDLLKRRGFHHYTDRWIEAENYRYFCNMAFFETLRKVLSKSPYPVVLVFEEVKWLFPKKSKLKYENQFLKFFIKQLSIMRSLGKGVKVYLTTQSLYGIPKELRDSCTDTVLFNLTTEDVMSLKNEFNLTSDSVAKVLNFKRGEFVILKDLILQKGESI